MDTIIEQVPCYNCITLAICKGQMLHNYKAKRAIFNDLFIKCRQLRDFVLYETKNEINEWDDDLAIPQYTVQVHVENTIAVITYVLGDKIADYYKDNPPM